MASLDGNLRSVRRRVAWSLATAAIGLCAGLVHAQVIDQRLDSIVVHGATQAQGVVQTPVLDKVLYSAEAEAPFTPHPLQGTHDLKACQGTGTRGLYCLDYDSSSNVYAVLRWVNPDREPEAEEEIRCSQLGLANCTAMTVNLAGHIFVAGQKDVNVATSYSLFKLMEKSPTTGACPGEAESETSAAEWNTAADDRYCFREYASNRGRIYDLKMIDGELSSNFLGQGGGVLALEDPAPGQVTFYKDAQPIPAPRRYVAPGDWGNPNLSGATVQGLTLVQYAGFSPAKNFALVTTSIGRVLAVELPWEGTRVSPFNTGLVLNATTMAVTQGDACTAGTIGQHPFDLSASARTRRVFFTSGSCVAAYDPVLGTQRRAPPLSFPTKSFGIAADFQTVNVAVSPGIEIDFVRDGCVTDAGCTLIPNGDNNAYDAARFAGIELLNYDIAGWVMYQVTGMPDCRYITPRPAICANAVINPDGTVDTTDNGTPSPTTQFLNITPLLPPEVTQATNLPPTMLLQPDYSARKSISTTRADYTFDAIFGIPEDDLTYRETFEGSFDVGDLIGSSLGCGGAPPLPANGLAPPPWDVVVNLSELAPTVGGTGGPEAVGGVVYPASGLPYPNTKQFVSMLVNDFCTNPTRLVGGRGSAFIYGLGLSPKFKDAQGRYVWPDSAYALLMRSLARDFNGHLYTYACQDLDSTPASLAPLSASTCYNLQKDWPVVLDKLLKCTNATDQPKNSAGSEACSSFETQFEPFKLQVFGATLQPDALDLQNRVGELWARMGVLSYVYYSQFKPSLKRGGFVNPN